MRIGNRVLYDQEGHIVYQTGEMQGDVSPRPEITQLHHVDLEYGSIDYSKYTIIGVDINTKEPILDEIIREKTPEEIIKELENQILLNEDEKVGGVL